MRKRRGLLLGLLLFVLFVAAVFVYVNANLLPVLIGLSNARVQSVAAKAMNDAILEQFSADGAYDAIVKIHASDTGVYLLQADSGRLNALAAQCANAAQMKILDLGEQGLSAPLGTVSGIPLLAGKGPRIEMSFTPVGAVKASFQSEFRSAGINQSLHRINVKLTATVRVILPGESHTLTVEAEAPIAENIIVGDVPNAYTNVANEEDLLNLVPGD